MDDSGDKDLYNHGYENNKKSAKMLKVDNSMYSDSSSNASQNQRNTEFIRLVLQSLQGMGYSEASKALQRESGIECESKPILNFRQNVLNGQWEQVISFVKDVFHGKYSNNNNR